MLAKPGDSYNLVLWAAINGSNSETSRCSYICRHRPHLIACIATYSRWSRYLPMRIHPVYVAQTIKAASSSVWNKHCILVLTISLYFETVTNFIFALSVYVCWGVCVCFIGWRFTKGIMQSTLTYIPRIYHWPIAWSVCSVPAFVGHLSRKCTH